MVRDDQGPDSYFVLPAIVTGPVEIRRLLREIEALEEYMVQANRRAPGQQIPLPKVSRVLDALASNNSMNLFQASDRIKLTEFLKDVQGKAPSIHISFASDPSSAFTVKMVTWLRANIHPYALLRLGLQPTLAAGCMVRTTNKVFDFSLRNRLKEQYPLLAAAIRQSVETP